MTSSRSGKVRWHRRIVAAGALLLLVAACSSSTHPAATAPPPNFGALASGSTQAANRLIGVKWDAARTAQFSTYLKQIAGVTFSEVVWCNVEGRPGSWDWSKSDQAVAAARRLGFAVYVKLRVGSCWVNHDRGGHARGAKTASAMPDSLGDYTSFVRSAVRRYWPAGVREFAVENEVNSLSMWNDSVANYVTLASAASAAIRSVQRDALVVDSGLGSTTYGVAIAARLLDSGSDAAAVAAYNRYYAARFATRSADFPAASDATALRQTLRGAQAQRDLAVQAATRQLEADGTLDVRQLHFYESWQAIPDLLAYLHATVPAATPVQAWEVGRYSSAGSRDAVVAAADVVKTTASLLSGGVRPVIWLPLVVNPHGRHAAEPRYGLVDPSGTVRSAGAAFAALATAARGATVVPLAGPFGGVAIGDSTSSLIIAWSGSAPQRLTRPAGPAVAADLTGQRLTWPATGLAVGGMPVLARVAAPVETAARVAA